MQALSIPVAMCVPPIASVATFITYVLQGSAPACLNSSTNLSLAGGTLDAAKAFTVVSFFVLVRMPFTILPMALPLFADCLVAFSRYSAFFSLDSDPVDLFGPTSVSNGESAAISISNGAFEYKMLRTQPLSQATATQGDQPGSAQQASPVVQKQDPAPDDASTEPNPVTQKQEFDADPLESSFKLTDLELDIKSPELVAVVGAVGSGKTSLLNAILGEIPRTGGTASVNGSMALVSQSPYIFNGTLEQNVRTAVQVCQ